ncbi:HpaII family restriction endonuclease [Rubritalea marina]|uniref:HpaII family restriction endonuclease n=1 Tax=Rubritalea marina TaxID=361055 RepID=UPI0003768989|nr:HpaII family restriction endonuclease [Rubritalea marina]
MRGNKGEWSEPYVLIKLLADGRLVQGAHDLSPSHDEPYRVVAVSRGEKVGDVLFEKFYSREGGVIGIHSDGKHIANKAIDEFSTCSALLLEEILQLKGKETVSSNLLEKLKALSIDSVKADSSKKADIDVTIHDHHTVTDLKLGFSVKSQLGSPSTLVNASKDNTNFRYRLSGDLSEETVLKLNEIDSRSKVRDRLQALKECGVTLYFDRVIGDHYQNNLLLLDRDLTHILSEALRYYYMGEGTQLGEIVSRLDVVNPLNYPGDCSSVSFYAYKLKRYLTESALGMMTAKQWDGIHEATGGYIVVKKDGELVSYHLLRKNLFEDYLLHNVKFETPSTTRHKYGEIYEHGGSFYINLNLQLRFTS